VLLTQPGSVTFGQLKDRVAAEVDHARFNAAEAAAGIPEVGQLEPEVMPEAARKEDAAKPRAPWRPSRMQAIVGGGALAAAIVAAVVLSLYPAPAPDPSSAASPVAGADKPSSTTPPAIVPGADPPPPTTTQPNTAAPAGAGTLVLDALPWADVVEIVDAEGTRQTLPPNASTPIVLELPPGDYSITLKNGSSRSLKARVDAGGTTRPAPVDFGQIDAAEYFRKLKW